VELKKDALVLDPKDGWGELLLSRSNPAINSGWTDTGRRETRQLKHRAERDVRPVPCPPALSRLLRAHLDEFGTAPDGRLFRAVRTNGFVSDSVYGRIWQKARRGALTPAEVVSPLAGRPYDLRHAAVSTWLNAGVPATQVAEWAGHSVNVLLRVYAKCIVGQDEISRRRVSEALGEPEIDREPKKQTEGDKQTEGEDSGPDRSAHVPRTTVEHRP
jgi:integrase